MAIFTAIGLAIAGTATIFGISVASMIAGALAFGTQLAISYLMRPKKRTYSAVQGQREFGGRVPAWALYGVGKVTGHHIFYAKWGSGNKFNADVLVLANGWCDGLEPEIYFYGEKHTLVPRAIIGNEAAHYGVDGFDNLISIRFYDGRPGQGPDTKLVADTVALGQRWKASSVCAGMAYVVVEREWSEAKFSKGQPDFEFILRGLRMYDPRKDSTQAGGSGPHRLGDLATYEFGETGRNPALQRLNYQLGLRGLRSGRTIIGEGKALGQVELGSYIAAMNVCDTLRNGKPTYQASLLVTGDDDHTEVLKEFDDAMAGYGMNRRGLSGIIAGAPQVPVASIGPDDLDIGRSKQIKLRKSAFDLYNHMSGQFTSPDANWSPQSLDPVVVNSDVAADGRPRQVANDFLQVTDPDIAAYLLQIRYRQNRKGGSATLPVSRRLGFRVMEGEWVTYAGKTWLVTAWNLDEQLQVTLTLAETGADVYASAGIVPGPIVVPPPAPINPSVLSTVQNFNVAVGFREGPDGFEIPTLRFTWTPPDDRTITNVRFEYFAGEDPTGKTLFRDQCDDPEAGEYETSKDVVPGFVHTAHATIRTVPDRLKTWTPWRTTAEATGPFQAYPPGLVEEVEEKAGKLTEFATYNARERLEGARQMIATDGASAGRAHLDSRRVTNEVAVQFEQTRAFVRNEIYVAVGPESAIAIQLNEQRAEYQAGIAANSSLILTEVSRIDNQLVAAGERIDLLTAEIGGIESAFTMRAQVVASPGGGSSRWVVQVQSGAPGNYISSALFLEADSNGIGSAGFITSRFFIVDPANPSTKAYPFAFEDGIARMNMANIGVVTAGELRSQDGKFVINLNAGWMEIFA